jgi:hypothetical protein
LDFTIMATTTGTANDDSWVVVSAGTFTLNGAGGIDTLFLGTSLAADYKVSVQSDGVHVDSVSAASSPLHATLQNMEVLVYRSGHDYQGIGNLNVAFFDGSKNSLNANLSRPTTNFKFSLTPNGYSAQAMDGLGQFTFNNIQRIQFSDKNLALDLSPTGNAALVAETLGAVLGAAAVNNTAYVGIGLKFVDQDTAATTTNQKLLDVMQLALNAVLGSNPSHAQVVDTLYFGVTGAHPSDAQAAPFVAQLDAGTATPASLGAMAAQLALNLNNINLTGLASTGLAYTGYAL